jgi:quinol monooxygenase YgiN
MRPADASLNPEGGHLMLSPSQPGTVLKFQAKPGKGDRLFELTNQLHFTGDPDGPTDWVLCRADDDPDTLWAFEFYKDDASFERHFSNPEIDKNHEEVIDLLAGPPTRVNVRPAYSGFTS